jgi:mono/diheme cytochrome c family protein
MYSSPDLKGSLMPPLRIFISRLWMVSLWLSGVVFLHSCSPEPVVVEEKDICCADSTKKMISGLPRTLIDGSKQPEPVAAPAPADIATGRSLYLKHGCGVCHGPDGHGDGPLAATLSPHPRDFREEAAFVQGRSVKEIAVTIERGVLKPGSTMPTFSHVPVDDRLKIAAYIAAMTLTE